MPVCAHPSITGYFTPYWLRFASTTIFLNLRCNMLKRPWQERALSPPQHMEKTALSNKFCVLFSGYEVFIPFDSPYINSFGVQKEDMQNLFRHMASPSRGEAGNQTGLWVVWEQQPRKGRLEHT